MLERQLTQTGEEIVRGNQVAALTLDGLDEHRRHALRRGDCGEELLESRHRVVRGHATGSRRKGSMKDRRQQRRKAPSLTRLRGGERKRTECSPVERADERDVAGPASGESRQLHRALDRLRARVGEEHLGRRARQDLRLQAFGELDLGLVVEIGAGHVEEAPGLLLDRRYHLRVGMAGGDDRDPGCEIEEPVAVDVGDPAAFAPLHHKGIGAGEAGRHRPGVPGDQGRGLGPGNRRLEKWFLTSCDHAREGIRRGAVTTPKTLRVGRIHSGRHPACLLPPKRGQESHSVNPIPGKTSSPVGGADRAMRRNRPVPSHNSRCVSPNGATGSHFERKELRDGGHRDAGWKPRSHRGLDRDRRHLHLFQHRISTPEGPQPGARPSGRDHGFPYDEVLAIRGRAELILEGADEHIDKLSRMYEGKPFESFLPDQTRVIVKVTPERIHVQ